MDEPILTHLRVRARRDGFRRCGRAWPAAGVTVPADDFSDDEIARLLDEPMLDVTAIADEAALDPDPPADAVAEAALASAGAATPHGGHPGANTSVSEAAPGAGGAKAPGAGAELPPISINTATATELADAMAGVNASLAQRIVDYRDAHGPFAALDDLVKVSGIGPATVAANRARLTV